jgi:hypothetical protein
MSNIDFKSNSLGSDVEEGVGAVPDGNDTTGKKQKDYKPGMRGAVHRGAVLGPGQCRAGRMADLAQIIIHCACSPLNAVRVY